MALYHTQLTSSMLGHGKNAGSTWTEVKKRKKDEHIFLLITLNMRFHLGNSGYLKYTQCRTGPLVTLFIWESDCYKFTLRIWRAWKLLGVNGVTCRAHMKTFPPIQNKVSGWNDIFIKTYPKILRAYIRWCTQKTELILYYAVWDTWMKTYICCHVPWPRPGKENVWHALKSYVLAIFWAIRLPPLYLNEVGQKEVARPRSQRITLAEIFGKSEDSTNRRLDRNAACCQPGCCNGYAI